MKRCVELIFVFLTLSSFAIGQSKCEEVSLDAKTKKQFDLFSKIQIEEMRNNKDLNVYTAFNLAEYYRAKADTSYRGWYHKFIDASQEKSSDYKNANLLVMLATAHYYLGEYSLAERYFKKADGNGYRYACMEYYLKAIKAKLKQ